MRGIVPAALAFRAPRAFDVNSNLSGFACLRAPRALIRNFDLRYDEQTRKVRPILLQKLRKVSAGVERDSRLEIRRYCLGGSYGLERLQNFFANCEQTLPILSTLFIERALQHFGSGECCHMNTGGLRIGTWQIS